MCRLTLVYRYGVGDEQDNNVNITHANPFLELTLFHHFLYFLDEAARMRRACWCTSHSIVEKNKLTNVSNLLKFINIPVNNG